jgi:formylglycine-generating enzyme required for sulfatase activity
MNLLGAIVGGIAKLSTAVAPTLGAILQTRSISTQSKAIALTQQRDSDTRELGIKRMEFDAKMEMMRQAVKAKEREEDREFSLSLKKIEFENLFKTEQMRQAFQALEAEKQRDFSQAIEKFKAEVQIALQADSIAFSRWKTETEREFTLALRALDAQIVRQRDKQNRDDAKRDLNSPVFAVADDILTMVLNREHMPLTIFFSPPVLRYDRLPNANQHHFPMMEATLSAALRDLFDSYTNAQRPIEFMAGEWITKNRRAESAVNQIYVDLKAIPGIVLETEVEESFLNINIGFWNNDFDDARFKTVVRKLRWQDASLEISQRSMQKWQVEGRGVTIEGGQTHPELIRRSREAFTHYMEVLHCIHVGMVADEYFLLYAPQRQLPFLPKLLPDLLEEVNLPEEERIALVHAVIDYANALFDGLAQTEPATIVELRLEWAKILQELPDRYTFSPQVHAAMQAWLKQRNIHNSSEPAIAISNLLIPEDQSFVSALNPFLAELELPLLNISLSCFQRGSRHLQDKQYQLAKLDFDRTISLNPHADAYYQRALACFGLEDYQSAIADFHKVSKLQPSRVEIYELLGDAYLKLGHDENAIANYNEAIKHGSTTSKTKLEAMQTEKAKRDRAEAARLKAEADKAEAERLAAEQLRKANHFQISKDVALETIHVKGGTFTMEGGHQVTLNYEYRIGKYPITQEQYEAVMETNPSQFKGKSDSAKRPVENVSWHDADKFCKKLSELLTKELNQKVEVRLPSETEWEYAARGGNKSEGYIYAGSNNIDEVAWYSGNSDSKTHPVGSKDKKPNELDIYDMSGNVWEWCGDNWTDNAQNLPENGEILLSSGSSSLHPARGGSWFDSAQACRSAYRCRSSYRYDGFGFRVVFSLV